MIYLEILNGLISFTQQTLLLFIRRYIMKESEFISFLIGIVVGVLICCVLIVAPMCVEDVALKRGCLSRGRPIPPTDRPILIHKMRDFRQKRLDSGRRPAIMYV